MAVTDLSLFPLCIIFPYLLQGVAEDDLSGEVESILEDINLKEKGDAITEKLSGGQKRKLSVGRCCPGLNVM